MCHEGSVVPGGRVVQGDAVSRERGCAGGGMLCLTKVIKKFGKTK